MIRMVKCIRLKAWRRRGRPQECRSGERARREENEEARHVIEASHMLQQYVVKNRSPASRRKEREAGNAKRARLWQARMAAARLWRARLCGGRAYGGRAYGRRAYGGRAYRLSYTRDCPIL